MVHIEYKTVQMHGESYTHTRWPKTVRNVKIAFDLATELKDRSVFSQLA